MWFRCGFVKSFFWRVFNTLKKKNVHCNMKKKPFFWEFIAKFDNTLRVTCDCDIRRVNHPCSFSGHGGMWRNVFFFWWTKSWSEISCHHVTCARWILPCQFFFFLFCVFFFFQNAHVMEICSAWILWFFSSITQLKISVFLKAVLF